MSTLVNRFTVLGLSSCVEQSGVERNILWSAPGFAASTFFLKLGARNAAKSSIEHYIARYSAKHVIDNSKAQDYFAKLMGEDTGASFGVHRMNFTPSKTDLKPTFVERIQRTLHASTRVSNWREDEPRARRTINDWARKQSKGLVTVAQSGPIAPDTVYLFLDIFYADAKWARPFSDVKGRTLSFSRPDGSSVNLGFFGGTVESDVFVDDDAGFSGGVLETEDPDLQVVLIKLAASGINGFLRDAPLDRLQRALNRTIRSQANWKIPRVALEMSQPHDIVALYESTGCSACVSITGDFSAMTSAPRVRRIIRQTNTFSLNQTGIRASSVASVRSILVSEKLPNAELAFDRPFVVLLYHRPTSSILLASYIADPSAHQAFSLGPVAD